MGKAQIALILVLLPCILPRIRHCFVSGTLVDFGPYYTAAILARQQQGIGIYNGADTGRNPVDVQADSTTLFAQTARRNGVQIAFLYLYPPILADMLIPVSYFPYVIAGRIWTVFNYAVLPIIALFITKLLRLQWISWGSLFVLMGIFSYSPVLQCIATGNVSILLLLLWACGIFFYMKGWHVASGFAFALATAIKLTPMIIVVPFLMWKEWRVLRAFLLSLLSLAVVTCLVNTPSSLADYFVHVMPHLSRGVLKINNLSISASVERLYAAFHYERISPVVVDNPPTAVILLGKACAAALLGTAALLTYSRDSAMRTEDRVMILALLAMLSACIAPVSWQHGYSLCFLAFSLLWFNALREPISNLQLTVLFLCTIALTTYPNNLVYTTLENNANHAMLASLVLLLTPVASIVLVFTKLISMRFPRAIRPSQ